MIDPDDGGAAEAVIDGHTSPRPSARAGGLEGGILRSERLESDASVSRHRVRRLSRDAFADGLFCAYTDRGVF